MTKEQRDLLICYLKVLAHVNAPSTLDITLAKTIVSLHRGINTLLPDTPLQWQELAIRLASFYIAQFLPYTIKLILADGQQTLSN